MIDPLWTRVGTIVDGDNRYFGRSVFHDWDTRMRESGDALLLALGVGEPDDTARECLRLLVLCTMSPDARVWPLKLARLLASHGDPLAGYFGAQLACTGKIMGPGAVGLAAQLLHAVAEAVGERPDDAAVARAVEDFKLRCGGRLGGFGVPFREVDERRTALLRLAGGALTEGRHWRLHSQVVAALPQLRPNCAISFAALLLDIGVAVERAGVAQAIVMGHVFLAHAVESAAGDGARLHSLPATAVDYRGTPARDSRDPRAPAQVPAALRRG
jgi:hypothetical protein